MRKNEPILTAALSLALLSTCSLALGEGVESRSHLPATQARVPGVQTLHSSSWGLFTLGGPSLRHQPKGKTQWQALHKVPGDNLYRLFADDQGRLLASWSKENKFHLFVPSLKKHLTFPKPSPSPGKPRAFSLDGLHFTKDGKAAILYMNGPAPGSKWTLVAYRVNLDGKGSAKELFRHTGYRLTSSHWGALYLEAKYPGSPCDYRGCSPLGAIRVFEIQGERMVERDILPQGKGEFSKARMAGESAEGEVGMILTDAKYVRHLLRWRPGQTKGTLSPIPKGPGGEDQKAFLAQNGDLLEAWVMGEEGLVVKRHFLKGGVKTYELPALPPGDPDVALDTRVYTLKERPKGGLLLHWGDHLVLLEDGRTPRSHNIEPLMGRLDEWAGVDIYMKEPETLWLGVEVGPSRDFIRAGIDEVEKRAEPVR